MKNYKFIRNEDETGVSGTGHVADVCEFPNGKAVMCWKGEPSSVAVYESVDELIEIHGHEGKAYLEPVDEEKDLVTDLPKSENPDMSGKL